MPPGYWPRSSCRPNAESSTDSCVEPMRRHDRWPSRRVGCRANSSRCARTTDAPILFHLLVTRRKADSTVITKPVRLASTLQFRQLSTTGGAPGVAPACIRRDQQRLGLSIRRATHVLPPTLDRPYRDSSRCRRSIPIDSPSLRCDLQIVACHTDIGLPARGGGGRRSPNVCWTARTPSCGVFAGRQVRPAFLNASDQLLLRRCSTEIARLLLPLRASSRAGRSYQKLLRPDRHRWRPSRVLALPLQAVATKSRATTRRPPCG